MPRIFAQLLILMGLVCSLTLRAEPEEYAKKLSDLHKTGGEWALLVYALKMNVERVPAEDKKGRDRMAMRTVEIWINGDADYDPLRLYRNADPNDLLERYFFTSFQWDQARLFNKVPPNEILEGLPEEAILALLRTTRLGALQKSQKRLEKSERLGALGWQGQQEAAKNILSHPLHVNELPYPLARPAGLLVNFGDLLTTVASATALQLALSYPNLFARAEALSLPLAALGAWGLAHIAEHANNQVRALSNRRLEKNAQTVCRRVASEN